MTLFESEIRKLNLPGCIIDSIMSLRNICMEAGEQPAQQPVQQQTQPQQQNTTQPQAQQNAQPQANTEQGQQPAQENTQPQVQPQQQAPQQQQPPPQQNQQASQNQNAQITENQVNADKLMESFNTYLEDCKKKVEAVLIKQFGENGKTIIDEVNQYVKSNEPIDFDVEIVPLLKNGKEAPQQKVIDDVRNRLQKYFGLKIKESKSAKK